MDHNPNPNVSRVERWKTRQIEKGGRACPRFMLPPEAAAALEHLVREGYALTPSGAICRALLEASQQQKTAP
jgi:hypothetical protein